MANGVLAKFVSRNNDHQGYWAIGQLYAEAIAEQARAIDFDLTRGDAKPPANNARAVGGRFRDYFAATVQKRGLSEDVVRLATLTVEFNVARPAKSPPQTTYGDLFVATLEIVDDHGWRYAAREFGWCAPHDDHRERRRTHPRQSVL